jgi:hypothetical protein
VWQLCIIHHWVGGKRRRKRENTPQREAVASQVHRHQLKSVYIETLGFTVETACDGRSKLALLLLLLLLVLKLKKRAVWAETRRRRCSHLPTHAMIGGCSRAPLRSHRAAERVGALPVASTVAMELRRRRESSE